MELDQVPFPPTDNKKERLEFPVRVLYEEWHPAENDEFWQRLETPSDPMKGSYKNPGRFEAKELYDTHGQRVVSHHERLLSRAQRYGAAFVVEHFIQERMGKLKNPKILEIGSWPMKNDIVSVQFDTTLIAILSQKFDHVVGIDKVDLSKAFPYRSYTPPYFGEAKFLNGDFLQHEMQQKITDQLESSPDVIIGNMVFERNLGQWEKRAPALPALVKRRLNGEPLFKKEDEKLTMVAENLSVAANSFLAHDGVMVISNSSHSGYGDTPEFIQSMPLLAVYMDERNRGVFAEVRGKK